MVYERDESGVRDARENLQDAQDDIAIAKIQEQIDLIEDEIELLEKQKSAIEKAMEASNEYYEKLIKQQEEYWDNLIESLENSKSKWDELVEMKEIAEAYALVEEKMRALGYTAEDVINDVPGAFDAFKDEWLKTLTDANAGNDDFLKGLAYVTDGASKAFGEISDSAGELEDSMQKISDATAPLADASNNITAVGTAAQGASTGAGALKTETKGIADNLDAINDVNFEQLNGAITDLNGRLTDIINLIVGEGSITAALEALNNGEYLTGIAASFMNLGSAINTVASALGAGGGMSAEGSGVVTGAAAGAAGVTSAMGGGSEDGGEGAGQGLIGAIQMVKSAADTYIGSNAEGEEGTAIGDFNALKESVDDVSSAIGIGEDVEEDDSTLRAAITSLYSTTEESLRGGDEGDGVIGMFQELCATINDCISKARELLAVIKELGEIGLPAISGSSGGDYRGTAYPHYAGTAALRGDWGVERGGRKLVGELGQELAVYPNGHFETLGDSGPEFRHIPKGSVIFNHLQTRQLLSKRNLIMPKSAQGLLSGTTYSAVDASALDLSNKLRGLNGIPSTGNIRNIINDQTKAIQGTINNISTVSNNPSVTVNNPSFVVSGITGEQVMRQIEGQFEGLMLNAYQRAMS